MSKKGNLTDILRTNNQRGWLNLAHLPVLTPPVTAKQRMIIIPHQAEPRLDGHRGKTLRKKRFYD